MKNTNKSEHFKAKLKQALTSTARAISDDFKIEENLNQNEISKKFDFFDLENLNSKNDFIKARAESDSAALKKKFSDENVYNKNLPLKSSYKSLYSIAEKIRYEALGCKMLKGIEKNLKENYNQIINLKKKEKIKSKEDVPVKEAFELYMMKKFLNIKLNSSTNDTLHFWEKDFDQAILEHLHFLKENLEFQDKYSSKLSEILEKMEIFRTDEDEEKNKENQEDNQNNQSNEENNDSEDKRDQNKEEETEASLDSEYDIDEYNLDEQLNDTEADQQHIEQVIQKKNSKDNGPL